MYGVGILRQAGPSQVTRQERDQVSPHTALLCAVKSDTLCSVGSLSSALCSSFTTWPCSPMATSPMTVGDMCCSGRRRTGETIVSSTLITPGSTDASNQYPSISKAMSRRRRSLAVWNCTTSCKTLTFGRPVSVLDSGAISRELIVVSSYHKFLQLPVLYLPSRTCRATRCVRHG